MNNRSRRDLEHVSDSTTQTRHLLDIIDAKYPELHRRDEQNTGPDGYPTSTGGSSESTVTTRNINSSTETAGMRLAERGTEPDIVHHARIHAVALIHEANRLYAAATSHVINALTLGETSRGRQSTVTICANPYCQRIIAGTERDRPRGGRCDTAGHWCYRYWQENGRDRKPEID